VSFSRKTKAEELTVREWVRVGLTSLGVVFCFHVAFSMGPRLQQPLEDFGSEIPALTRLVLMPWFPLLLGLIPSFVVALALVGKTSLGLRRALIAGAFFFSISASIFCLYALYSPVFALAGTIR
jgi:hypothetical protein